jgi:hypothetical protein
MVRYENHCCDCATPSYPCMGEQCPLRRVAVYYCDNPKCRAVLDEIFEVDDGEYCEECLKDMFRRKC